jgi:hypothetical protein
MSEEGSPVIHVRVFDYMFAVLRNLTEELLKQRVPDALTEEFEMIDDAPVLVVNAQLLAMFIMILDCVKDVSRSWTKENVPKDIRKLSKELRRKQPMWDFLRELGEHGELEPEVKAMIARRLLEQFVPKP